MSQPSDSESDLSPAAQAFADYIAERDRGLEVDFEAFCRERPVVAEKLRRLHARYERLQVALTEMTAPIEQGGDEEAGAGDDSTAVMLASLKRQRTASQRYEVGEEIAHGGMGAIHRAWDRDLRRHLAMKVLLSRPDARFEPRALARFLEEAQITGQLEHPGVLPVHDIGIDPAGRIYFTMPLVRGETLESIIDAVHSEAGRTERDWPGVLGVLVRVCEAMGYAHARGVIHRDLKPANVMVGSFGETYVMDWGLARVVGAAPPAGPLSSPRPETVRHSAAEPREDSPVATREGDVVGTPSYMAPEQARGSLLEIGPACDVYSVGAILYHLLTGRRPYESGERQTAERVLEALQARIPEPIHQLAPDVPVELEAICERAMAREPRQRYATMTHLGSDLRAFLEGRVVRAYETGAWAELRKWTRRNSGMAIVSTLALLLLLAGFSISTSLYVRSTRSEGLARRRAGEALEEKARADRTAGRLAAELRASRIARGRVLARTPGRAASYALAEMLLWRAFLQCPDDRAAHWALWELFSHHPQVAAWQAHPGSVQSVAFCSSDRMVTGGDRGMVRLWNLRTNEVVTEVCAHEGLVYEVDVSPDGRWLASCGFNDGEVALFALSDLTPIGRVRAHQKGVSSVQFHPRLDRLVTAGRDGGVREWNVPALTEYAHHPAWIRAVHDVRYDSRGEHLLWCTSAGEVRLVTTGGPAVGKSWRPHRGAALAALFAEGDRRVVSTGRDGRIAIREIETGREQTLFADPTEPIRDLVLLPDQQVLVAAGRSWLAFWDLETRTRRSRYGLSHEALDLDLSSDGRLVAVAGIRGDVRVFEAWPRGDRFILSGHVPPTVLCFSPDGRKVLTGDGTGAVRVFDASTGRLLSSLEAHEKSIDGIEFSVDGAVLATLARGRLVLRDGSTDRSIGELRGFSARAQRPFDLASDGRRVLLATSRGSAVLEDLAKENRTLFRHSGHPAIGAPAVCLNEARGEVVTAALDAAVMVWTLDGRLVARVSLDATPWALDVSADGRFLAVGLSNRSILVLDAATRATVAVLQGHGGIVRDVRFHPSSPDLLASIADDGTMRLWHLERESDLLTWDIANDLQPSRHAMLAFSPDGLTLAAAGEGDVLLCDLAYFERHMAGNLSFQLERWRASDTARLTPDMGGLRAWGEEVRSRERPERARGSKAR